MLFCLCRNLTHFSEIELPAPSQTIAQEDNKPILKRGISIDPIVKTENLTRNINMQREAKTGYGHRRIVTTQREKFENQKTSININNQQPNTNDNRKLNSNLNIDISFNNLFARSSKKNMQNEPGTFLDRKFDQAARKGLKSRAASRRGFGYFYKASYQKYYKVRVVILKLIAN